MKTTHSHKLTLTMPRVTSPLAALLLCAEACGPESPGLASEQMARQVPERQEQAIRSAATPMSRVTAPATKPFPADLGPTHFTAYGVGKHSTACGGSDLPNVLPEIDGFAAGSRRISSNAVWKDHEVWGTDFHRDSDYYVSTSTATGFDGIDAGLIGYLSSHGGHTGSEYLASMGNPAMGCTASSADMSLGNASLRYLFLSTCFSMHKGPASDGTRPDLPGGVDPFATWRNAGQGARCILGYSTVQADDSRYGSLFWSTYYRSGTKLASTFFDVSTAIQPAQIPMVLCFGGSSAESQANLDVEWFDSSPVPNSSRSLRYRMPSPVTPLRGQDPLGERALPILHVDASGILDAGRLNQVQARLRSSPASDDAKTDVSIKYSDADAIALARDFLLTEQLIDAQTLATLQVLTVFHEAQVDEGAAPVLRRKLVAFRQQASGVPVLGGENLIMVELDSQGRVRRIHDDSHRLSNITGDDVLLIHDTAKARQLVIDKALTTVRKLLGPSANPEVRSIEFGYALEQTDSAGAVRPSYRVIISPDASHTGKLQQISVPAA